MSPAISFYPDFLPDSPALFEALQDEIEWDSAMAARKTASFGVPYNYSQMSYPAREFPAPLAALLPLLHAKLGWMPNNCLINFYPDGDSSMGFHFDATNNLAPETGVTILSLGEERVLTFARRDDKAIRFEQPMPSGSLLFMDFAVQAEWLHAVLKQSGAGTRMSLTLRQLLI